MLKALQLQGFFLCYVPLASFVLAAAAGKAPQW